MKKAISLMGLGARYAILAVVGEMLWGNSKDLFFPVLVSIEHVCD